MSDEIVFYSVYINQFIILGIELDGDVFLDSGEEKVYSADLSYEEVYNKLFDLGAIYLGKF